MLDNLPNRLKSLGPIFLITVAIPTTIAILYFGLIASDVYISESRFVVRATEKQELPSLGSLIKGSISSSSTSELYAVKDYATSRDALRSLNHDGAVTRAYTADGIDVFDRFNGWGLHGDFEHLFSYYKGHVEIEQDTGSSITTMKVRAYSPEDARLLNERLLLLSEGLINDLNQRSQADMIRFADNEVKDAQRQAREAAMALSAYRNRSNVIDPEKQAAAQVQLTSALEAQLIAAKTQLAQLQSNAPRNPAIPALQARIARLSGELGGQVRRIAGGNGSLASVAAQYQKAALDSQFADRNLASALASLEAARNDARRKQVYIERIVQPNTPDDAAEPRRFRGIFATFALGMIAWGILTMLLAGLREHND